jgi:hypothetical protein
VGEDIVANSPEGKVPRARLRLRVSNLVQGDELTVRLNGKAFGNAVPAEPLTARPAATRFEFQPAPRLFRAGDNRVEVQLATRRSIGQSVTLDRLDLVVRYRPEEANRPLEVR